MKSVLRVLQLNAASFFEPDWPARRVEILAWLDRLDPDVVCLQEIWQDRDGRDSAGWLVDQQPEGRWFGCFGGVEVPAPSDGGGTVHLGSAVLSRWPIESHDLHPMRAEHAKAASELVVARTAGVDVFCTHLPPGWRTARARRTMVREIDSIARRHTVAPSSMPPVLCGDFNCEPDSDEIRFLTGLTSIDGVDTCWQDAWRVAGRTGPGHTADPSNPYFAPFRLSARRIDYVFVGETVVSHAELAEGGLSDEGTFPGKVLGAEVVCDEPLTGTYASDHYGLCVDIAWTA